MLVLQGGLGNAQFGVRTQHALDNVEEVGTVVCAGVAGALSEKLSVGDVVVATATIEHDFNWLRGERPAFQGHGPYVSALREQVTPPGSAFKLHFGPVASGDEAIVDMARARELHESTGALAVAWEGAGGARAAAFSGVPFVEVRGISDMADREARTCGRRTYRARWETSPRCSTPSSGSLLRAVPAKELRGPRFTIALRRGLRTVDRSFHFS